MGSLRFFLPARFSAGRPQKVCPKRPKVTPSSRTASVVCMRRPRARGQLLIGPKPFVVLSDVKLSEEESCTASRVFTSRHRSRVPSATGCIRSSNSMRWLAKKRYMAWAWLHEEVGLGDAVERLGSQRGQDEAQARIEPFIRQFGVGGDA